MAQCQAITNSKRQCKNETMPGSNYCRKTSHQQQKPKSFKQKVADYCLLHINGIIIGILITAFIPSAYYFYDKKVNAVTGEIASRKNAKELKIALGTVINTVKVPDGKVFVDQDGKELLKVEIENRKLLVSAIFYNKAGEVIAQLVRNKWMINNNAAWKRNYTDDAIEVIDSSGKVAAQVINMGDIINVEGVFRCKNNKGIAVTHSPDGTSAHWKLFDENGDHNLDIKPICDYENIDKEVGKCPGIKGVKDLLKKHNASYELDKGALTICSYK